jgi:hypothetical protein
MKYDSIVGGIEYSENVQTIVSGGKEIIVGDNIKKALRDRILFLKHVKKDDTKKLLSIINISRPVLFGYTEYDDGDKKIINKNANTDTALKNVLENRINMEPNDVVNNMVREYNLKEHVYNSLTEMIQILLKYIIHKFPNMKAIKIDGDIGELLARVKNGDDYFKIATHHKKKVLNIPSIIHKLLNILKQGSTHTGPWDPVCVLPLWPELDKNIIKDMKKFNSNKCNSIRNYVKTIVMREHILLNYLDSVENYYIDTTRCVEKYTSNIVKFLSFNSHI